MTDSGMCRCRATGSDQREAARETRGEPPDRPPGKGPTPTPEVLDDVQGGAPRETLHGPQLQPGQGAGQRLQLIGTPLLPVEKHAEAQGGLPTRPGPSEAGRPRGPGSPRPGRRGHRAAEGLQGPWAGLGRELSLPGEGACLPGAAGGPELTNGRAGPTQSAFLPLLQHFTNFHFPAPSEPPRRGWAGGGDAEARKRVRLFRPLCSDKFSEEKNVLPQEQSQPPGPDL